MNHSKSPTDSESRSPTWVEKFSVAGRGVYIAFTQEKSFIIHFLVTAAVIVAGLVLGFSRLDWCVVTLCIMAGLSSELLNTAIERLSLAITEEFNPHIRDALDIASGAVFIISLGALVLATLVLGNAAWRFFFEVA